ncbi:DUF3800 domain-containing protein [Xanthomonas campestris]|uniref:DUF3800 domain-containing protein n=1 Tax=Xanthomonas campestris TaxID=339 RepID=UPI00388EF996
MYFYVDESGQTGHNLFDENQPMLYYGVCSSRLNLGVLLKPHFSALTKRLGWSELHANQLGVRELSRAAPTIERLIQEYKIDFDLYRIAKIDFALICFFDQVFDQGVNPAMTWSGYWSPMRYVLLLKVAALFDEDTLKRAWKARIELNPIRAQAELVLICRELRSRVHVLPDARSRQLVGDSLLWAEENPVEISYNAINRKHRDQISPNLIAFQSVMHGVARRLATTARKATEIVVDEQTQFNRAQEFLSEHHSKMSGQILPLGPGLPAADYRNAPKTLITIASSETNPGIQLSDTFIWIFRRYMEQRPLSDSLLSIVRRLGRRSLFDEITLDAISKRWTRWFDDLPDIDDQALEKGKELVALDEARRVKPGSSSSA